MKITVEIHRDEKGRPSILDVKRGRRKFRVEVMATDAVGHASKIELSGSRGSLPALGDTLSFFDGHIARIDVIDLIELIDKIAEITVIKTIQNIESFPALTVVGSEGVALKQATAGAGAWNDPDGFTAGDWSNEAQAYDNNVATNASKYRLPTGWSEFLILTYSSPIKSNKLRFYVDAHSSFNLIDIDAKIGGVWTNIYEGAFDPLTWIEKLFSEGQVDAIRIRFYHTWRANYQMRVWEVDLWSVPSTGGELEIVDVTPP